MFLIKFFCFLKKKNIYYFFFFFFFFDGQLSWFFIFLFCSYGQLRWFFFFFHFVFRVQIYRGMLDQTCTNLLYQYESCDQAILNMLTSKRIDYCRIYSYSEISGECWSTKLVQLVGITC